MRIIACVALMLTHCAEPQLSPAVRTSALDAVVLVGDKGPRGADPLTDAARLTAMIDASACASRLQSFDNGLCDASGALMSVSGANGVQSSGGETPTVAMNGTFSGTLVVEKTSGALPDATLTLTEAHAGAATPGADFTRIAFRESSDANAAQWLLAARVNRGSGGSEPNSNQLFFNAYYDNEGADAGNDSVRFRGQGDVDFPPRGASVNQSKLVAGSIVVQAGTTTADLPPGATLATVRATHNGANGTAVRAQGRVDLMNTTSPGVAQNLLYTTPGTHYANANAVRLPIYRVRETGSAASVDANCQNTDVVIGGSCTPASATFNVQLSYPDVPNNQWVCVFNAAGAHVATAMCLKSY